jgi:carboxyl-terminal processing protease
LAGPIGTTRRSQQLHLRQHDLSYRVADEIEKDYNEAVSTITSNYSGDIDHEKATQAAIQGMLSTLDPHSAYFPYGEFKKLKEDQDSRFYGIGVTIVQHRDGVYVQSAVEGTPAAKLGVEIRRSYLEVDGKDARDWTSEQVSKNVRGGWANRSRSKLNVRVPKRRCTSRLFATPFRCRRFATRT